MERLLVISADCHAGLSNEEYKEYLEKEYHDPLDRYTQAEVSGWSTWRKRGGAVVQRASITTKELMKEWEEQDAVLRGGEAGVQDPNRRLQELDADGVVGEVIFPQAIPLEGGFALKSGSPTSMTCTPEQRMAGARAYNRWLAEFCKVEPERHIGLATFPSLADVDGVVNDIRWARKQGLRGVVLAPEPGQPLLYDERYDPIWSICAELGMPVHFHGGGGCPERHANTDAGWASLVFEVTWFAHRPFWHLMWGGVFERYPNLKVVFTEQGSDWIPDVLERLDRMYENKLKNPRLKMGQIEELRKSLRLKPSEYWQRQCFVGASTISREEVELRYEIGVGTIMFGSDYPHFEGTWPNTPKYLRDVFAGLPENDVRLLAGQNAVRAYDFDMTKLGPIVERIGPRIEDVISPG